jgi:hypothetical protein
MERFDSRGQGKKLTGAVEHWFSGPRKSENLASDARAFGLEPPEDDQPAADYGVWEENWPAVELFLRCQTQWRARPGGLIGLDYGVLLALATMYLPASTEAQTVLEEVQIMERRALELFNEAAKRERSS